MLAPLAARAGDVVSMNLCTDDYLVLLAPERIAALSPLARDPSLSVVAAQARHLPWVRADGEAVMNLHPSLVLAAPYGAQTTVAVLEGLGVRIERIALAQDFAAIRKETRRLAALLGVPARGESLIAAMDQDLSGVRTGRKLRALALAPRGYAAGPGTLEDSVLRAAGLDDIGRGGRLGLEAILAARPQLLVVADAPGFPSLATDMLTHPILAAIPRRALPPALLACAGPWSAAAVAMLAR
ncbi:MAG: ABC transporter substrate-binding protein [Rhodospirillales bacterium]|nr:ABC transporter substrate-binding protein [Rhodospirillales bacterium]